MKPQEKIDYEKALEEIGVHLPRKPKELYIDIVTGKVTRAVVKGCRGGSKSWTAAVIEFVMWRKGYDWFNLGGSLTQAKKVYGLVVKFIKRVPRVLKDTVKTILSETEHIAGQMLWCASASPKQTRSPHCGGENQGGGLTIDEEGEAAEDVVLSALPVVNTANPSVIIRMSTLHKLTGSFRKLWLAADRRGYKRYEWDCFDICQPCTDNCKECFKEFREDYCKGKAKHADGYMLISEIKQMWIECAENHEWFEVEFLGREPIGTGKIYNTRQIESCEVEEVDYESGYPTILGIDWGWLLNRTCWVVVQFKGKERRVVHCRYLTAPSQQMVEDNLKDIAKHYPFDEIRPDNSENYLNNEMALLGYEVHPVVFSKEKDSGISNVRNGFEHKYYKIPRRFKELLEQLKAYTRGKDGKPLKIDDHAPDALLCASEAVKPHIDLEKLNKKREEENEEVFEAIEHVRIGDDD